MLQQAVAFQAALAQSSEQLEALLKEHSQLQAEHLHEQQKGQQAAASCNLLREEHKVTLSMLLDMEARSVVSFSGCCEPSCTLRGPVSLGG